jgi:hypothetical protein
MRRSIRFAFMALSAAAGTAATACRIYTPSADLAVTHAELPRQLPTGAFVAEVQFERPDRSWLELRDGARARVRRVVQGDYRGDFVIVRDTAQFRITCYNPFRNEGSGFIVGTPTGFENGILVLEPIFASPPLPSR